MKRCPRCLEAKNTNQFGINTHSKDGLSAYCMACMRLYRIEHYRKNKKIYMDRARKRKKLVQAQISKLKESSPCTDCGISYPHYVMDYDHVRGEKKFNLSVAGAWGQEAIEEELLKCDLVCSNCHRIRTHKPRE